MAVQTGRATRRRLWETLHNQLKHNVESHLLLYVDRMIRENFQSYCGKDGRVIDKRLAERIGVSRSVISRWRQGKPGAFTRLEHFLAVMSLCGVNWAEVGFPSPQAAVLEALRHVFPVAYRLRDSAAAPLATPSSEQVLALYFSWNLPEWREAEYGGSAAECREAFAMLRTLIRNVENDDGLGDPAPLVPRPRINSLEELREVIDRYGPTWQLMYDTFPFLSAASSPLASGSSWGIF